MTQFKNTEKKLYRPPGDSRRDIIRMDSYQILQNSMISRPPQRNQNIHTQLLSNYNDIKQLLKDRKVLLRSKYQILLAKNKQRINSIATARDSDLKNQARMLNDRSIIDLVDQAQSLGKSKTFITRVSQIRDMGGFINGQRNSGKQFWDRQQAYRAQKKNKLQNFQNNNKIINDLQKKVKIIFNQIQGLEYQMSNELKRNRNDPNHIKQAQFLYDKIQQKKNQLRQIKKQKDKAKLAMQDTIDNILQFNKVSQNMFDKRINQLKDIFAGTENINQFQNLMTSLEKVLQTKGLEGKTQSSSAVIQDFNQIFRKYDIIYQEVQKLKEEQDHAFNFVNDQLKQKVKGAIMQKVLLQGILVKNDHKQLIKKCKQYRKLLFDFNQQIPSLKQQISKMLAISNSLYPIKKGLSTQQIRRQQLKRQLKKLCTLNSDMEVKEKEQRNFAYDIQQLINKKKIIEAQINQSADKGNLTEYKNNFRELQQVNKKISQKNDAVLSQQLQILRRQIQDRLNKLYQLYEDLIKQVQMSEQPSLGVFITNLQKRLSLI